jgi:hypothetical protein
VIMKECGNVTDAATTPKTLSRSHAPTVTKCGTRQSKLSC